MFSIDVYALLHHDLTFSFVTPLVAVRFNFFLVSTIVGDFVLVKRFYKGCPVSLRNRVTLVELVELDMLDFDLILGVDWLHSCFAFIICRTWVIKFPFPNLPVVEWKGVNLAPKSQIISFF